MSGAATAVVERRPALAPWYRTVQAPGRVLLEHGGSVVTLEGQAADRLLPVLLPLLDGRRTVGEIVEALGRASDGPVRRAIALLDEHGLLVDDPPDADEADDGAAEAARFASACASGALAPSHARERLAAARVVVAGGAPVAGELVRLLREAGVPAVSRRPLDALPEKLDLLAVAPARQETDALSAANERSLARRLPWLQLVPHDGRFAVVGPLFLPGESACHECYRIRRAAASDYEDDFELVERRPTRAASPAALGAVTAGLTALLAIRWLAGRDPSLPGRAYTIGTRAVLELVAHRVLRVPRCPACGEAPEALPSPWYKEAARDG